MILINGFEVTVKYFPDGTLNLNDCCAPFIKSQGEWDKGDNVKREDYIITWRYESPAELTILMYLNAHVREVLMAKSVVLELPYIPNARMDRTKSKFSEVFTLKYFAQIINSMNFDLVYVLDPHSNVSEALFDRLVVVEADVLHREAIKEFEPDFLFYPDAGAMKRYSGFSGMPYLYGEKTRDWKTGKIMGMELKNPFQIPARNFADKRILIIDDICSRGGTFDLAAQELKKAGFGVIGLCVTHLENTVFAGKLLGADHPLEKIYTTNSIHHAEHDKIHTFDIEFE